MTSVETEQRVSAGRSLKRAVLTSGFGVSGKLLQFLCFSALAAVIAPAQFGVFSILQIVLLGVASIASSSYAFAANDALASLCRSGATISLADAIALALRGLGAAVPVIGILGACGLPVVVALLGGGAPQPVALVALLGASTFCIVVTDAAVGAVAGTGAMRASSLLDGARGTVSGLAVLVLGMTVGPWAAGFGIIAFDYLLTSFAIVALLRRRRHLPVAPRTHHTLVSAGVAANSAAQVASWVLVWAVQAVAGLPGVGAYGLANRFATVALLVPSFMSKNVLGLLNTAVRGTRRALAVRYIGVVLATTVGAAAIAVALVALAPGAVWGDYPGLVPATIALLAGTTVRAVATAAGIVCVSLGQYRRWLLSDLGGLVVTLGLVAIATIFRAPLVVVLLVFAVANLVTLTIRVPAVLRADRGSKDGADHG